MRKSIVLLIFVLIITAALMAGCTAVPGSQDGYQRGGGYGAGNGSGIGGGNGQRFADATPYIQPEASPDYSAVSPEQQAAGAGLSVVTDGYGSSGALADSELTLEEMLTYSLQDEYLAHAEYAYIISAYGNVRPFSNVIKAEEQHISELLVLFTAYGAAAPADTGSEHTAVVSSLTEAYQAGEKAEINNIAMYDAFLKQDIPDDVRLVFESLKSASENHLSAFRQHI